MDESPSATVTTSKRAVMPAEWLPHDATWLSWPRNTDTWPKRLSQAQAEFVELVRAIAADETARVMAGPGVDADSAHAALAKIGNVEIVPIQTNDAWARDYAPTFLVAHNRQRLIAVDWFYNAWGGKYPPFEDDQKVASRVAQFLGSKHRPVDLCLEGGAIEIDQHGLVLCTKTCAFDDHRNPGLSESEIERRICEALEIEQIVWLTGDALVGDDTDGHIDQLARFTPADSILYAWTDDQSDPQYQGLRTNFEDLKRGLSEFGISRSLVPLPIPDPVLVDDVQIPACYCNFYITNRSVIVPSFGAAQDERAAKIIGEQFSDRQLVVLPSTYLTVGLGSFHCLTQQQPQLTATV